MIGRFHPKWCQRIALLAMAALLCSQLALARHDGCLEVQNPTAAIAATVADAPHEHIPGCDSELSSANQPLCDAHCSAGEVSAESARPPSVPPLFTGSWLPWFAVSHVASSGPTATSIWLDSPPRPARHRPTAHPAALLLI